MEKAKADIDYKNAVITIRGLEKSFADFEVLRGIDLDLYQGENLVVLGRSGTGKSVLIKIISGLLRPDKGEVMVLGKDISKITDKELEREKGGSGLRYSFDVFSKGKTYEVGVDAQTGAVLENGREGAHPD